MIDDLDHTHPTGLYRMSMGSDILYYKQDPELCPSSLIMNPNKRELTSITNELVGEDNIYVQNHSNIILQEKLLGRHTKRKRDCKEKLDRILEQAVSELITLALVKNNMLRKTSYKY